MPPSAREKFSWSSAREYSQRENKESVGMVFSRERAQDLLSRQVLIKAFEVQEEREKREQTEGIQRGIKEFWERWICLSSGLWQWFCKCIHRAENIKLYTLNICNLLFVSYTLLTLMRDREREKETCASIPNRSSGRIQNPENKWLPGGMSRRIGS